MVTVADIDLMTSLLEQCLLYNKSDYNPFITQTLLDKLQPSVSVDTHIDAETAKDDQSTIVALKQDMASPVINPLLQIDLDFNTPNSTDLLIRAITPMMRSTNRRPRQLQGRSKKKYVLRTHSNAHLKKKQRSKPVDLEENQSHKEPITTPVSKLNFLSLPGEIRESIYLHLFDKARIYINLKPNCKHAFDLHLGIRSVCKNINEETSRALFKRLTVVLQCEEVTCQVVPTIERYLTRPVVERLESLVITPFYLSRRKDSHVSLNSLPSLKRIQTIEVGWNISSIYRLDGLVTDADTKAQKKLEDEKENMNRDDIDINYTMEVCGHTVEDRASHMGALKRERFQTVLLSHSAGGVTRKNLTIAECQLRCEMYQWIESRGIALSPSSFGSITLRRLDRRMYHEALDQMENGIAKSQAKQDKLAKD